MPVTIPRDEEMAKKARRLYVPGVLGYKAIARQLGISATTVRRYVDPEYHEHLRILSLEAKRRRTGICQECGGETRYNGRTINAPSLICNACNHKRLTHCANGHLLTPEIDLRDKYPGSTCRICRNAYMRKWQAKRRREAGTPEHKKHYRRPLEEKLLAALESEEAP